MRRLAMVACCALGLAACASPDPSLYAIASVPGSPQAGGPPVVVVRDVALARYLQRSQIVRSSENYRLDVLSNDWWGEPLGAMLVRVLVEELSQRLPGSAVYPESGAVSARPDASVELNLQRLDEDADGNLVLVAQVAVVNEKRRAAPVARNFRFIVRPSRRGPAGEVAAVSTALGQLADQLAVMLHRPSMS